MNNTVKRKQHLKSTNFTLNKVVENWHIIFFGHATSFNNCEKSETTDVDIQTDKHILKKDQYDGYTLFMKLYTIAHFHASLQSKSDLQS